MWMEKNKTEELPSMTSENIEEKKLGIIFHNIKGDLVKPYLNLQSEELKQGYRKNHPELDDVLLLMIEINQNPRTKREKLLNERIKQDLMERGKLEIYDVKNKDVTLNRMQDIKRWMEERKSVKPPRAQIHMNNKRLQESELSDEQKEEKRLGNIYADIKNRVINPYEKLVTEKEKDEFKIYYPNIEEIIKIKNDIEKNNNPIKENQVKLIQIRQIKEWMKKNKTTKPPSTISDNEEEKKLGIALSNIRQSLLKPYKKLKSEEEKAEYIRQHPELEEVMATVEEIDKKNIPIYLQNAIAIKQWMEENNKTNPPRKQNNNKTVPKEEAELGNKLKTIRQRLIKPYEELENEGEKAEYRRKHPELEEVMAIVEEIDKKNNPIYLQNAIEIKKWMEENNKSIPPRRQNEKRTIPEGEARLGEALGSIRKRLIKPYKELKNEEEKAEYIRQHSKLEEVMAIVEEIDTKNKKKIKDTVKQNKDNLSEAMQVGEEFEAEILMAEKITERSASDGRRQ